MRHLYRPLRNRLDPCRAKKILLISLAQAFEQNRSKKQKFSEYPVEIEESAEEFDIDLEGECLQLPDEWLEGIDFNAFDVLDFIPNQEAAQTADQEEDSVPGPGSLGPD